MEVLTGSVHHVTLRVGNVSRSAAFYAELLGFKQSVTLGSRVLLSNGSAMLVLTPLTDSMTGVSANSLDEEQVGVERLCFRVGSYQELEQAVSLLDKHSVPHSEVTDWGPDLGQYVLAFRDPDNIPLALAASYG
jgi:catechol 2,3-dioxygenase-like lactoylglutathione lyase family enzyme